MPTFEYTFKVNAPLKAVSDFHHDTSVLKILTPPPIYVQIHDFEPLGEGSLAEFTMWFGPIPVHWQVVHSNVDEHGFTDTIIQGPLKHWQHTHHFSSLGEETTLVRETIEYEYKSGLRGLLSRIFFSKPALFFLFTARKWITRQRVAAANGEPSS